MSDDTERFVWHTKVSELATDFATLYGYGVDDLATTSSFTAAAYLAFTGELPTTAQCAMFDRMLVLTIAHGVAPSGVLTRSLIACGSPVQAAMAAGALSIGDVHGGAGEQIARALQERILQRAADHGVAKAAAEAVDEYLAEPGARVPGFGHQYHHDGDPRAKFILDSADELKVSGPACAVIRAMEDVLATRKGRRILINADGAIASVLLDLHIDWRFSRPFMIIGRAPTLAAHAVEELSHRSRHWRELMVVGEQYEGPAPRRVDD